VKVYCVTSDYKGDENWFKRVELLLSIGIDRLQYRDKNSPMAQKYEIAKRLKNMCTYYKTPFIINNHVDLALAISSDGVHLGENDLPVSVARKMLGSEKIIGGSARTIARMTTLQREGVDYLGIGACFKTSTKSDVDYISRDDLVTLMRNAKVPIYAIGGIDVTNVNNLSNLGLEGVAISGALMSTSDPERVIYSARNL